MLMHTLSDVLLKMICVLSKIWNGELNEGLYENNNPIKINVSTIGRIVR
jgi:hypothetical protein